MRHGFPDDRCLGSPDFRIRHQSVVANFVGQPFLIATFSNGRAALPCCGPW
jgi:hypothetical protein